MENRRNRDDEFATHYYGNEKDLRERDRMARNERNEGREHARRAVHQDEPRKGMGGSQNDVHSSRERVMAESPYSSNDISERSPRTSDVHDRSSRESDIGREPYEPNRHNYRAAEDREYYSDSGRKNWKQLYNDFFADFSTLFKKESELIRTELGEKADMVKAGAVSITTGTIVAFVGIQVIAATIVIALGYIMPWWAAALVTGVALLLIGGAMMAAAKKKLSGDNLTPYRSMDSFEHMGHMLKEKKDEFTRH